MFPQLTFHINELNKQQAQQAWKRIVARPELAITPKVRFSADCQVLTLGSCFVNEIRAFLELGGLSIHPLIDPALAPLFADRVKSNPAWGPWDERIHYQCFTPFTIEQEVKVALGMLNFEDDTILRRRVKGEDLYIDPCRRLVYSRAHKDALEIRRRMNEQMRLGLEKAELIIFTLGLVEAFKLAGTEMFVSEYNPALGEKELEYYEGNHARVLESLERTMELIFARFPNKQIVLTVSPIPMARTFSADDVMTATTRSKSILRSAVDTIVQRYANVHYWPSYEFAMWNGKAFREDDCRHVKRDVVSKITAAFCQAYFPAEVCAKIEALNDGAAFPLKSGLLKRLTHKLRRAA